MNQVNATNTPAVDSQNQPGAENSALGNVNLARFYDQLKDGQFGIAGLVMECLPNTMFRVEVMDSQVPQLVGKTLLCTLAGKMRLNRIRVMPGDKVIGYVTKYDLQSGKITFRVK